MGKGTEFFRWMAQWDVQMIQWHTQQRGGHPPQRSVTIYFPRQLTGAEQLVIACAMAEQLGMQAIQFSIEANTRGEWEVVGTRFSDGESSGERKPLPPDAWTANVTQLQGGKMQPPQYSTPAPVPARRMRPTGGRKLTAEQVVAARERYAAEMDATIPQIADELHLSLATTRQMLAGVTYAEMGGPHHHEAAGPETHERNGITWHSKYE